MADVLAHERRSYASSSISQHQVQATRNVAKRTLSGAGFCAEAVDAATGEQREGAHS